MTAGDETGHLPCINSDIAQASASVIVVSYEVQVGESRACHSVAALGESTLVAVDEMPHPLDCRPVPGGK